MKRNITLAGIVVVTLFIGLVCAGVGVKADWVASDVVYDVENISSANEVSEWSSSSNQIFYVNSSDQWYILYADDLGTNDYSLKYSFSDVGDITTWNNGGVITSTKIRDASYTGLAVGYQFAWVYSENNSIGHLVYLEDATVISHGLFYQNFTITGGGGLIFGSERELVDHDGGNVYGSVDIALAQTSEYPIIGYGGYWGIDYYTYGIICNSNDGYNGFWDWVYYQPQYHITAVSIFPTGSRSCIIINGDGSTENPLLYFAIDFDSTSNSSGGGSVFSDNSLDRYDCLNNQDVVWFGINYNTTHGAVHYSATDYNSYAFIFDFATITKTDEYKTSYGGGSNTFTTWNGLGIQDNEFFSVMERRDATNKDVFGNEYHNSLYDGYFNYTAEEYILEDYSSLAWSEYSGSPVNTARMTDNNGVCLIMVENGAFVSVTYWTIDGEYAPTEEPEPEPEVPYDWGYYVDEMGWFVLIGFIVMIGVFALGMKIKYESRRY